ncbi:MAG: 30S ribosomal protein S2 [Planctomycetota bacterium]
MTDEKQPSLVQDLIEAGIHFGQRTSGWNPKMSPYIYGKRAGIHIIDIKETIKGLLLAKKFIGRTVAEGKDICFVGTKRQARSILEERATDVGMHYVTERWLGGILTNFRTIRQRLTRLEELEAIHEKDDFQSYSKKMESQLKREMRKIKRNLDGIRRMEKLPGALVIIDVRRELTALAEARKLRIPTICLIDTDGDPALADIPIPGNDDSMRSIDVVVRELCKSIAEGKSMRPAGGDQPEPDTQDDSGRGQARRSRRAQFRASDPAPRPADDAGSAAGPSTGPAAPAAGPAAPAPAAPARAD